MEVKEVLGSPRTGVMDGEPPCGCWGLNLQELGVLLVSESSLQTLEGLSLEDSPQNLCLTLRLWKQTAGTRAQTVMPSELHVVRLREVLIIFQSLSALRELTILWVKSFFLCGRTGFAK